MNLSEKERLSVVLHEESHQCVPCSPTLLLEYALESEVYLYRFIFPRPPVSFLSFIILWCYLDMTTILVTL